MLEKSNFFEAFTFFFTTLSLYVSSLIFGARANCGIYVTDASAFGGPKNDSEQNVVYSAGFPLFSRWKHVGFMTRIHPPAHVIPNPVCVSLCACTLLPSFLPSSPTYVSTVTRLIFRCERFSSVLSAFYEFLYYIATNY